jgi:hypothetical protein
MTPIRQHRKGRTETRQKWIQRGAAILERAKPMKRCLTSTTLILLIGCVAMAVVAFGQTGLGGDTRKSSSLSSADKHFVSEAAEGRLADRTWQACAAQGFEPGGQGLRAEDGGGSQQGE